MDTTKDDVWDESNESNDKPYVSNDKLYVSNETGEVCIAHTLTESEILERKKRREKRKGMNIYVGLLLF